MALCKQNNTKRMRLNNPNSASLNVLRGSNIELMLGLPNPDLQTIASSQVEANTWVQNNVKNFPDVRIKYIAVGNEVQPFSPEAAFVVPAMQNIQTALNNAGLANQIKVSTAIDTRVLGIPLPPSHCSFRNDACLLLNNVVRFLNHSRSPLLVNLYTYKDYENPVVNRIDYPFFWAPPMKTIDGEFRYRTLFDTIPDAIYVALEKVGGGNLEIVISEGWWPLAEDRRTLFDNPFQQYVNGGGTPRRPGKAIEIFPFSMFNERINEKNLSGRSNLNITNQL